METQSKVLVVLGMHRSGTSMMMRLCNILGVPIGEDLVSSRDDNQTGFWEHRKVVDINERIFEIFQLNSQDVVSLPDDWLQHKEVQELKTELIDTLKHCFADEKIWGLKDPRIGMLLPLWTDVFSALDVSPSFIIPFRHPQEVAESLVKRDHITFERGILLWLQYNLALEHHSRVFPRCFVHFPDLAKKPKRLLYDIADQLNINWPSAIKEKVKDIDTFIRPDLHHHQARPGQMTPFPYIVTKIYNALLAASKGLSIDAQEVDSIAADFKFFFTPFEESIKATNPTLAKWRETPEQFEHEIEMLEGKLVEKEEQIISLQREVDASQEMTANILSSASWKMTKPLRELKQQITKIKRTEDA